MNLWLFFSIPVLLRAVPTLFWGYSFPLLAACFLLLVTFSSAIYLICTRVIGERKTSSIKSMTGSEITTRGSSRLRLKLKNAHIAGAIEPWTAEQEAANIAEQVRRHRENMWRERGNVFVHALTIVAFLSLLLPIWAAYHRQDYPVETWKNVWVWYQKRNQPQTWGVWTPDYGWKEINCCPDFDCRTVIDTGWIMDDFSFEERGTCKSIRAQGLGVSWRKNNENGRAIQ